MPWGNTKLMFDDVTYSPQKVQKEINKIGAPFEAPKDSFVHLSLLSGSPVATFAIDEEPVEDFVVQEYSGDGYKEILNQVAKHLKEKFPKSKN